MTTIAAVRGIEKLTPPELRKLVDVALGLGMDPDHLAAVISFETGGTFSPSIKNPGSSATGLIQFMESTARRLGTTTAELAGMSVIEQLDWVARYFASWSGRLHSVADVYMAVFAPVGVGQAESFVLYADPTAAYQANKGLDSNGDGTITKGEAASRPAGILWSAQQRARIEVSEYSYAQGQPLEGSTGGGAFAVGAVLLGGALWLVLKGRRA
jgi:hypothetical protein